MRYFHLILANNIIGLHKGNQRDKINDGKVLHIPQHNKYDINQWRNLWNQLQKVKSFKPNKKNTKCFNDSHVGTGNYLIVWFIDLDVFIYFLVKDQKSYTKVDYDNH